MFMRSMPRLWLTKALMPQRAGRMIPMIASAPLAAVGQGYMHSEPTA